MQLTTTILNMYYWTQARAVTYLKPLKASCYSISSQLTGDALPAEMWPAATNNPALQKGTSKPPQSEVAKLIKNLKGLFLLEGTKLYHKLWQELKLKVSQPPEVTGVTVDNTYIIKLTNTVRVLVNKQKQCRNNPLDGVA
jgi:hypothetical protein